MQRRAIVVAAAVALLWATAALGQADTPTPTITPDDTKTATATGTATQTGTPTRTGTPTWTPTATPTSTPTATSTGTATLTGTVTQTPTPTLDPKQILAKNETCASPNCDLTAVDAGPGIKTIVVSTNTGTATVLAMCRNGGGYLPSEVSLGSLSGATCTTSANCLLTTTAWCDQIFLRVTACGSSCRITGWLRTDTYHQR